ncbi:hypothetical protein YDYSY3_02430 [Paenibacillus chitinolyticus]|nr:hypothetical protein YDYSY3_02430 [Paenibacillus chitinolyticus]
MNLFDWLARKYAVYCPKCQHELNHFSWSSNGLDTFKCLNCNEFYEETNDNSLVLTDSPLHFPSQKFDPAQKHYQGIISSYAYGPEWLNFFRRIFSKKTIKRSLSNKKES